METLIDKKKVAELLNISVKTLDLRLAKGTGPKALRLGRLVRFKESEVQDFIERLSQEEK